MGDRFNEQLTDAGAVPIVAALVGITVLLARCGRDRAIRTRTLRFATHPPGVVLLAVALGGFAALLSSSNRGVFFALPLLCATIPLTVRLVGELPRAVRLALACALVVQATIANASGWALLPEGTIVSPSYTESILGQYDRRFDSAHREDAERAAASWLAVDRWVADRLRILHDRGAAFTMTGNTVLLNTNTVALVGQLDGWNTDFRVPDTEASAAARAASLTARDWSRDGRRVERVLVVVRGDHIRFTPDARSERFRSEALRGGWRVVDSRSLPSGGTVEILRRGDTA